jgi:hypothetical protein
MATRSAASSRASPARHRHQRPPRPTHLEIERTIAWLTGYRLTIRYERHAPCSPHFSSPRPSPATRTPKHETETRS